MNIQKTSLHPPPPPPYHNGPLPLTFSSLLLHWILREPSFPLNMFEQFWLRRNKKRRYYYILLVVGFIRLKLNHITSEYSASIVLLFPAPRPPRPPQ
jgi:hypothetical protein